MKKRVDVRISGSGGQGVVKAGEILGRAAFYDGKYVVQTQSYGAEARGSAAKSEVIVSNEQIGFPKVRKCDILVAMNQKALNMHLDDLREDGTLLVDGDEVKEVPEAGARVFKVPATKIAKTEFKDTIYANVVMLGALVEMTHLVSEKATKKAIIDSVPKETREKNIRGFKKGLELHRG